jgi:hypothetical protein
LDGHRWARLPYYIDNRQLPRAHTRGQTERVLDLDRDTKGCSVRKQFSSSGGLFVWATSMAPCRVCDIAEVRRRLTEIGLGW